MVRAESHGGGLPPADALKEVIASLCTGADAPPGACLAVARDDAVAWAAAGVARRPTDGADPTAPMDPTTRTDLGSVTKILATATSLAVLEAAGEIDLEAPVGTRLAVAADAPCARATLRDLLEHRAGLWEWWPIYLHATEPAAALATAAGLELRHPPGRARHYSDLGFQLLGAVVAAATGLALDAAVDTLVLEPLALAATAYARPVPGAPVAASSWGDRIERRMIETGEPYPVAGDSATFTGWRTDVLCGEVNDGNAFHAYGSIAGHAGLFSTTEDLLSYGEAVRHGLDGDGPLGPARDALRRFLSPGADPDQGLGFRRWPTRAGDAWGHTGFPGVAVAVVPRAQLTVALVTNRLHAPPDRSPRPTEPMWTATLDAVCRGIER